MPKLPSDVENCKHRHVRLIRTFKTLFCLYNECHCEVCHDRVVLVAKHSEYYARL